MTTAHFSKGGQFYQYDDKDEFNSIIDRIYHLMRCKNIEGIADYLRIDKIEVSDSLRSKRIPIEWFKRFFFVIYTYVDELQTGNKQYRDEDYFNKMYDKFISGVDCEMMDIIIKHSKGAMLADDSIDQLSKEELEKKVYDIVSKKFADKE